MRQGTHPQLQASLLCEDVSTDTEGRHTIHNEFSQYTMGYSRPFTVMTIWRGDDDLADNTYREKTEFIAPDGRVVAAGESPAFKLRDNTYRQINTILLENVDFTNDGVYDWRITLVDQTDDPVAIISYPLTVN